MLFGMEDAVYILAIIVLYIQECNGTKKCMKNDDIGWREGNIYYCEDPAYSECCEVHREFICCEKNSDRNAREQLQLWGTVAVFALAMFILYVYFRRDYTCFSMPSLSESWRSFKAIFSFRKKFEIQRTGNQYKEGITMGKFSHEDRHCSLTSSSDSSDARDIRV